ncbi:MAG: hypothetical protein KDA78_07075 [Planctomycetaceae bacterium]|nr:hypothetical protein [Planctomycetaceae bacterium]
MMSSVYYLKGDEPVFDLLSSGNYNVLRVAADPGSHNYDSRRFEYNRLFQQIGVSIPSYLIFELSQCRNMEPVTLRMMADLTLRARQCHGDACLVSCSPELEERIAQVSELLPSSRRFLWSGYQTLADGVAGAIRFATQQN